MKILIVNWQDIKNPRAGGAEVHLHEVTKRMVKNGISCILYVSGFAGAASDDVQDGIEIHRRGSRWNFNFTVWFSIRKWIKRHNPDIVIDDSNKIPFLLPWLSPVPVLVRIHHLFRGSIFREVPVFTGLYVYILETLGIFSWKNSKVVTVSGSSRQELESLGIKQVSVALNGVDKTRYYSDGNVSKQAHGLLYLGRVKRYKGIDTLIEVALILQQKFPGVILNIAGEGDDLPRLKLMVENKKAESTIKFRGFVSEEEKRRLYSESTLMLISSLKEGYGLTTIEANACGTCVVAADVPGLNDSIKNNQTGFLVPYGKVQAFVDKIEEYFSDAPLRETMQKAALEWAGTHTWDNTYTKTMEVIKEFNTGNKIHA